MVRRTRLLPVVLAFVFTVVGTQSPLGAKKKPPPPPDFLDESFSSAEVSEIVVLSVADVRLDKSVEFKKLDEIGHRAVKGLLRKSPYQIKYNIDRDMVGQVTLDDLEYMDSSWIKSLGPEDSNWILLLALQDAAKKKTFGSAYGAVCSGYFFDKSTGKAVWHHETVGTMGQGGLAGLAMKGAMRGAAFETCVGNLLVTFPERRRRKN